MTNGAASPDGEVSLYRTTELIMIVVFAVLLTTVPESLIQVESGTATYLIVAVMLLFVEAYLVLHTYHRRLRQAYDLTYFGFDIVLIGLFVTVVRLFEASTTSPDLLSNGLWIGLVVFVLLFVRQLGSYNRAKQSPARLEQAGLSQAELLTPMIADFAGVAVCAAILLAESTTVSIGSTDTWAVVGFVSALLYFVVKYLLVIQVSFGRKR